MENVAHASIMQLDKFSMDRLWDLITMIYKWQTTMSSNIVDVTRKHLSELLPLTNSPSTRTLLQNAQFKFEQYIQKFNPPEIQHIRSALLLWLNVFRVRVSILLKLGLQNDDGTFVQDDGYDGVFLNPESSSLLRNLGTNIFTKHKSIDSTIEIASFVDQLKGEQKGMGNFINLKINDANGKKEIDFKREKYFEVVDCSRNTGLSDLFVDSAIELPDDSDDDFTNVLLNIISDIKLD